MKSFATFIFIIVFTTQLFCQDLARKTIIGTWKVVDSQIRPEMQTGLDTKGMKMMEQMRIGFIGTILNFEGSKKFTIKYADNIPTFMKELEFLNNKNWKIEKGQRIAIGTEKDGYSLMGITVKNKHGKKYFILDETPYILEVVQQGK